MFKNLRQTLSLGWEIGTFSYKFILKNKKLIIFPTLSAINICVIIFLLRKIFQSDMSFALSFLLVALSYFALIFMMIFINVAVLATVSDYLKGNKASIVLGLRISFSKIIQIAFWAITAGSIGVFLPLFEKIEEEVIHVPIISWVLEISWAAATCFVIPIICFSGEKNPFTLVKKSAATLQGCWRKNQISRMVGSFAVSCVLGLPLMILLSCQFLLGFPGLFEMTIAYGVTLVAFNSVANTVLQTIYYRYATEGFVPDGLNPNLLENVCITK